MTYAENFYSGCRPVYGSSGSGIFVAVWTNLKSSRKLCALFYYVLVERLFAFSISRDTGVAKLLVPFVARSSAVRLIVAKSCHCETQCLCCN